MLCFKLNEECFCNNYKINCLWELFLKILFCNNFGRDGWEFNRGRGRGWESQPHRVTRLRISGVPLRWGSLRCKSKFWARNFKFWAQDVHPTISQAQVPLLWGSLRYSANRNSGREISNSGPEMCTPLFLRPKSKPAGREKPIRVAPIRVVTKYPRIAASIVFWFRACFKGVLDTIAPLSRGWRPKAV